MFYTDRFFYPQSIENVNDAIAVLPELGFSVIRTKTSYESHEKK